MRNTFYPSDEYDSRDLELEASRNSKRLWRRWLGERRQDDDDDPPTSPAAAIRPRPIPPLVDAQAA